MDHLYDAAEREVIRTSLDESFVVEAAAGTGKTTQLVSRLVAVVARGKAEVDRIVAVTFTRKAAGELKLRFRQELETGRTQATDPEVRERLRLAIAQLEQARIGTIHSFCAEILRERPVEAGIDPDFKELSEDAAPRLFGQAFSSWIQEKLNEMPEALSRALQRLASNPGFSKEPPLERLRQAAWELAEWRDFRMPWERRPFDRTAELDRLIDHIGQLADLSRSGRSGDSLRRWLQPLQDFQERLRKSDKLRDNHRDYDLLESEVIYLRKVLKSRKRKGRGAYSSQVSREDLLSLSEGVLEAIERFLQRADADLAALLQLEMQGLLDRYQELKRRSGTLDFVDLLFITRDLIRNNQEVRAHLQDRFSHLFIDEFQDTDPLQAEILLLLASDDQAQQNWTQVSVVPGKLFIVGDPKQSIYRFRRADVVLYQTVRKILVDAGCKTINLSTNFRSVETIQTMINAAFAPVMADGDTDKGQPAYVALSPPKASDGTLSFPTHESAPAVVALPVPNIHGWSYVTNRAIEESQPTVIAAYIKWLVHDSGWTVRDLEDPSRRVPIRPGHICILFRRFTSWGSDVSRPYLRALDARRIPHVLVGSRTFHRREEVDALRAALTAVEWPGDEVAVFATLKGPLFSIPDDLLLRYRFEVGRPHPFQERPSEIDEALQPVADCLDLLARLHRDRNEKPMVETIEELLRFTRAHANFALWPAGDQVLGNVQRVCDLARSFELGGGLSFRGFVQRLGEESEKARVTESPVLEEGLEGVRLMTLHSAKGLEFPVVILGDITARLSSREPSRFVDLETGVCAIRLLGCRPWELNDNTELESGRDEAEGVRIAYVAATRARDLLVAPVVGEAASRVDGWIGPLNDALYPPNEALRDSDAPPEGLCPPFGESSVLSEPRIRDSLVHAQVRPGVHRPIRGRHRVLWWDPDSLDLDVELDFGLRQEEILSTPSTDDPKDSGMEAFLKWKTRRLDALEAGSSPAYQLFSPTRAEAGAEGWLDQVRLELLERRDARPGGRRFGILVHTILRDVELNADIGRVTQFAELHGRMMQASRRETQHAASAVSVALHHTVFEEARRSSRVLRETPFQIPCSDGRRVEGVIDLMFETSEGWTVIDFKTDLEDDTRQGLYRNQVSWYLMAVAEMTGRPVTGWLLGV